MTVDESVLGYLAGASMVWLGLLVWIITRR